MLLLDFRTPAVPMPVPDYLSQSERAVTEQQEENLEAVGVGGAFPPHDYLADSLIYAVGPVGGEKNELYAVRSEGSPEGPVNRVFISAARKLLSFNVKKEPYPQTDNLDFDPNGGPPRPAVIRALTETVTKHNARGKPPLIVAL